MANSTAQYGIHEPVIPYLEGCRCDYCEKFACSLQLARRLAAYVTIVCLMILNRDDAIICKLRITGQRQDELSSTKTESPVKPPKRRPVNRDIQIGTF
jgi:hypothetical protein